MLTDYVMEFLAVVAFLHGRDGAMLRDGHLFVKKEALLRLLDKNRYDTAMNKLTVWRGLQWIDCDRERSPGGCRLTVSRSQPSKYGSLCGSYCSS